MSPARAPCSAGTSRGSSACTTTPKLYNKEAVQAATAPRSTKGMNEPHIRSTAAIAVDRGAVALLWSRWGRDWRAAATPQSVTEDLVGHGLTGGDILLLHDAEHYAAPGSWHATVGALPRVLDAIGHAGLRCATL